MTGRERFYFWGGIVVMTVAMLWLFAVAARGQVCGPNGCLPLPAITVPDQPVAVHPAVCRVRNEMGRQSYLGTGALIDVGEGHGLVVTAAHIFSQGAGKVTCEFAGKPPLEAVPTKDKDGYDVAALLIADPGIQPIPVAERSPAVRETAVVYGYGTGRYAVRRATIVRIDQNRVTVTGAARDGDSGGPILNGRGELIGVLWGTDGREIEGTAYVRTDVFLQRAARYLLPWNAKINDPARDPRNQPPVVVNPSMPGPSQQPVDLSPLSGQLAAILAAVQELKRPAEGQPVAPLPVPPAEDAAAKAGEKAAEGVLEKAGLLTRVKERVESVIGWPHILGGAGLGLGGIALIAGVAVMLIRRDLKARKETGDPLAIEKLLSLNQRLLERIPGERLDTVNEKLSSLVERLADRIAPKPAPPAPPVV